MTECCKDTENHRRDHDSGVVDCMSCGATISHVPDAGVQAIEALAKINPEAILFEPRNLWDQAVVGITCKPADRWERPNSPWVAVYDFEMAVGLHANQADDDVIGDEFLTEIERATEWVMYNSVGSWLGPNTPTWAKSPHDMTLEDDLQHARGEAESLRGCLKEARNHVYRQQFAGKHEQDRSDALEWLAKWDKG
jgi:hypothetical protein